MYISFNKVSKTETDSSTKLQMFVKHLPIRFLSEWWFVWQPINDDPTAPTFHANTRGHGDANDLSGSLSFKCFQKHETLHSE